MPVRLCSTPRCPEVATCRGRCAGHARERNAETRSQNKHIYNKKRWILLRRRKLFLSPLCEWEGCDEIATDVHHVQALQAGGLPYSLSNLQALCHSHHSRITRQEQATT